jgi:hypothetical protein
MANSQNSLKASSNGGFFQQFCVLFFLFSILLEQCRFSAKAAYRRLSFRNDLVMFRYGICRKTVNRVRLS